MGSALQGITIDGNAAVSDHPQKSTVANMIVKLYPLMQRSNLLLDSEKLILFIHKSCDSENESSV